MNWKVFAALASLAVVGMLGWDLRQYWAAASPPSTAATPVQLPQPILRASPEEIQATTEEEQKPLDATATTLDGSDSDVMLATNDLAPQLVQWITPSEQIRKWVALVDQIAAGKIPQKNRPLDYPLTEFVVTHDGNTLLFDKANYQRTDWLINVVTTISPIRLAHYYHAWRPVLDKAYAELGVRGGFDQRLHIAIKNVLAVKPLTSTPALTIPGVYYQYADPNLEKASDIQKLLWRLGPYNTEKLQAFLRELERQL